MRFLWLLLLALSTVSLAGCEIVGDIFEVGVWVGGIIVVLVVAIIGFVVAKLRG